MSQIEIFYFSGTGNTLFIANELKKRIPEAKLVPIVQVLNEKRFKTNADTVGFLFPVYISTMPKPVRQLIEKLDMSSVDYTFMIATRLGTFHITQPLMELLLKKKKLHLNAAKVLTMAQNTPTGIAPGKGDSKWMEKVSKDKLKKMDEKALLEIDEMAQLIKEKKSKSAGKRSFLGSMMTGLMDSMTKNMSSEVGYCVDETCNGCGLCESVCLSGKIKMIEELPEWQKNVPCYYCFACFNFCPQQSILVRNKYEVKEGRYHHPAVSIKDIQAQK